MNISFKNCNIRTKIFSGFLVVILILLILATVTYLTIGDINRKSYLLLDTERINNLVLEMRKNENAFLLRELKNPDFFETGKSEYLGKFDKNYETLKELIGKLKDNKELASGKNGLQKLDQTSVALHNYYSNFYKVVTEIKGKGFKDYGKIGKLREAVHNIEDKIETLSEHEDLEILMLNMRRAEKDYILRQDTKYHDEFLRNTEEFKVALKEFEIDEKTKEELSEFLDEYKNKFNDVVNIEKKIGLDENSGLNKEYINSVNQLEPIVDELRENLAKKANENIENSERIIIISSIISVLVAMAFAINLSIIITKPIKKTNVRLKDISEGDGDLTKELSSRTTDELGMLAKSFNLFIKKIRYIVKEVKNTSNILSSSTNELTVVTEQSNKNIESISREMNVISEGLQNNSSIVEEATASIQEMASGSEIVSIEARNVTENSEEMLKIANEGKVQLNEVVNKIESIENSSNNVYSVIADLKETMDKIEEIVVVIAGISDQTNLLALNAAIEAARAGEDGKGFAVVANEVRKLAEESKNSTDKITALINKIEDSVKFAYDSVQKQQKIVQTSVVKANETNVEFENILDIIKQTVEKINMISKSSSQQSSIAKDMAVAMDEIAKTTEKSAVASQQISSNIEEEVSGFEEIVAKITELNNMSDNLKEQTGKFKVN